MKPIEWRCMNCGNVHPTEYIHLPCANCKELIPRWAQQLIKNQEGQEPAEQVATLGALLRFKPEDIAKKKAAVGDWMDEKEEE